MYPFGDNCTLGSMDTLYPCRHTMVTMVTIHCTNRLTTVYIVMYPICIMVTMVTIQYIHRVELCT